MDAIRMNHEAGPSRTEVLLAGQQRILEMIAKSEPLEVVLTALATFIEEQSPGTYCAILGRAANNTFYRCAVPSLPESFQKAIDGHPILSNSTACGAAASNGTQVISADIATDSLWEDCRDWMINEHGLRSAWATPIFSPCGTNVVGVFALYAKTPGAPSTEEQELIGISTHLAEIAFERKRTLEDLRRAKCEAEDASFAKSKFLANISHELRTPLNAIIGYSEILMEELEDIGQPSLARDMENVHMAGQRLLNMIGSILDISKIQADMMQVRPISFSIASVVDEVIAFADPYVKEKGNRLTVKSQVDVDTMFADSDKLTQILQHLLSNANKFTEKGEITLSVSRDPLDADNFVLFKVDDSGIGMTPERMDNVFTAFVQIEDSLVKAHGGIGLGLALSYSYANMMGGDIQVQSEVNKGTTVTVRLPIIMNAPV